MTSRSLVSTSNVCSCPTDFAGSPSWTGSASMPARAIDERRAVLAEPADQQVRRQRREVADRPDAVLAQGDRRLLADAPQPTDRRAAPGRPPRRRAARRPGRRACAGRTRSWPRASCVATPTEAVSPTSAADLVLDPARDRRAVAEQRRRPGDVEERLVDRDRLDQRREPPQDRHHVAAGRLVAPAVDRQEDRRPDSAGTPRAATSPSGPRRRAPRSSPPRPRRARPRRRRRRR